MGSCEALLQKLSADNHGASGDGRSPLGDGDSFAGRRCQIFVILIKVLSFTFGDGLLCALRAREEAIFCRGQVTAQADRRSGSIRSSTPSRRTMACSSAPAT